MIIQIWDDSEKTFQLNDNDSNPIYHNEYGPSFHSGGDIREYMINDEYHNIHGPAFINAGFNIEIYYLEGIEYTKKDWEVHRHDYCGEY